MFNQCRYIILLIQNLSLLHTHDDHDGVIVVPSMVVITSLSGDTALMGIIEV